MAPSQERHLRREIRRRPARQSEPVHPGDDRVATECTEREGRIGVLQVVEECEPPRIDGAGEPVGGTDYQPTGRHERGGVALERLADRGRLGRFSKRLPAGRVPLDRPPEGWPTVGEPAGDVDQTVLIGRRERLVDGANDAGERRDARSQPRQRLRQRGWQDGRELSRRQVQAPCTTAALPRRP